MESASRNRAALALVLLLAGLGATVAYRNFGDKDHIESGWPLGDAGLPPTRCWFGVVRGPSAVWSFLKLKPGASNLAAAKMCFYEPPGCADGGPVEAINDAGETIDICAGTSQITLPSGIEWTPADEWFRDYIPGEPVFEVWAAEHADAPWRCANGAQGIDDDDKGAPCQRLVRATGDTTVWTAATVNDEMGPGEWRGNCAKHPCADWNGMPSYHPAKACKGACDGVPKYIVTDAGTDEDAGCHVEPIVIRPRDCWDEDGGARKNDAGVKSYTQCPDAGTEIVCERIKWKAYQEKKEPWECGVDRCGASCGECDQDHVCKGHKCVEEEYEDPAFECGPTARTGKIRRSCTQPLDSVDAGLCYGPVTCKDHRCLSELVKCATDDNDAGEGTLP